MTDSPFTPLRDIVVVELEPRDYVTPISGVIVPAEAQVLDVTGEVIAVGPEVRHYAIGDTVLFPDAHGQESQIRDKRYKLLEERQILGRCAPAGAD